MDDIRQAHPWCKSPGVGQHGPEVQFHERDVVLFPGSSKPSQPGMYFRRIGLISDPDFCKAHYFDGSQWVDADGNEIDQTLQWYALKNDPTEKVFAKQMGRVFEMSRIPRMTPPRGSDIPPPSLQNGKPVDHKPPVSMSVHAGRPASTGSDLKPTSNADSPINNARFCRRTGAPEMMSRPIDNPSPSQIAEAKNADVLRVLAASKQAMTPTEIAWAVDKSGGT